MSEPKTYRITEIFFSLQGEGPRAGTPALFVRFSGCNMKCTKEEQGFDCDTDHENGRDLAALDIRNDLLSLTRKCSWVVLTGGEPMMQLDHNLLELLTEAGFNIAIETNGTIPIPVFWPQIQWIAVSPKRVRPGQPGLRMGSANELRVVTPANVEPRIPRGFDTPWPCVSPVFNGNEIDRASLEWCVDWCLRNPEWRLSVQQHKGWRVR